MGPLRASHYVCHLWAAGAVPRLELTFLAFVSALAFTIDIVIISLELPSDSKSIRFQHVILLTDDANDDYCYNDDGAGA